MRQAPAAAGWARLARDAATAVVVFVLLLPAIATAVSSFGGGGFARGWVHWWARGRGWSALLRTLGVSGLAAGIALALGWGLAAAAVRWSRRAATLVALLACLPMLVPASTLATAWIAVAGRQAVLGRLAARAGLSVYSLPAAALVLAVRYFGIAAAMLTHQRLRSLAAEPARRAFRVGALAGWLHLRLRPGLRAALGAGLIVMLFCMNDHVIPDLLLVSTYGPLILVQYSARMDPAGAAALGWGVGCVGLALAALGLWLARGQRGPMGGAGTDDAAPASPGGRIAGACAALAILGVALGVPVCVLAAQVESWWAPLRALVEPGGPAALTDLRTPLGQTLLCSLAAGAVSVALAAWLAGDWVRARRLGRLSPAPVVLVNLALPATLPAMGVIHLGQHAALGAAAPGAGAAPLVFAYVVRFVPVATLVLYALWRDEPHDEALAARVHGVRAPATLRWIVWPRRKRSLLAAAVLVGLLAATELDMSILLAEPGRMTLGIRLYNLIHTAPPAAVGALTLGILVLAGPGMAILMLLLGRGVR